MGKRFTEVNVYYAAETSREEQRKANNLVCDLAENYRGKWGAQRAHYGESNIQIGYACDFYERADAESFAESMDAVESPWIQRIEVRESIFQSSR